MDEKKEIKGYGGRYFVTREGKVLSWAVWIGAQGAVRRMMGKELKVFADRGGYLHLILWKNKKGKHHSVHTLVAQAFIPNPNRLKEVNHLNSNKKDNRVENLEWCTHKENMHHAVKNNRWPKKYANKH